MLRVIVRAALGWYRDPRWLLGTSAGSRITDSYCRPDPSICINKTRDLVLHDLCEQYFRYGM